MHLKRLLAPKFWKIEKKYFKWVTRPRGPYKIEESIPLLIIIRDILKIAENGKEAKKIIKMGEVLVDKRKVKDHKFGVGVFDVISIPKIGKNFRIVPSDKGYEVIEIDEIFSNKKVCKIIGKKMQKKGKIQINLHDGNNILMDKDNYKVGDSLIISLPEKNILKHLKLEVGAKVIAFKGKNIGTYGKILNIREGSFKEKAKAFVESENKKVWILKEHLVPIDEKLW